MLRWLKNKYHDYKGCLLGEHLEEYERWYGRRRCTCGSRRLVRATFADGWLCLACGVWWCPEEDQDGIDPVDRISMGG